MKLILENWKRYLKEHEEEKPLGKYVFPKDMSPPDPEKEKEINTTLEDELRGALADHFRGTEVWSDPINAIKELIANNDYPEIFKRYTKGEVYRGIYVTREWMKETFGDAPEFEILHKESDPKMLEVDYNAIVPLLEGRLVSSWTTDYMQAVEFSKAPSTSKSSYGYGKDISLILVADSRKEKNYFIDMNPFYDYKFGYRFAIEAEVLAVGEIKTTKVMWTDTSWFTQRSKYEKEKENDLAITINKT